MGGIIGITKAYAFLFRVPKCICSAKFIFTDIRGSGGGQGLVLQTIHHLHEPCPATKVPEVDLDSVEGPLSSPLKIRDCIPDQRLPTPTATSSEVLLPLLVHGEGAITFCTPTLLSTCGSFCYGGWFQGGMISGHCAAETYNTCHAATRSCLVHVQDLGSTPRPIHPHAPQTLELDCPGDSEQCRVADLLPDTVYRVSIRSYDCVCRWSPWSRSRYCSTLPVLQVWKGIHQTGRECRLVE